VPSRTAVTLPLAAMFEQSREPHERWFPIMKKIMIVALILLAPGGTAAQQAPPNDKTVVSPAPQGATLKGFFGVRGGIFVESGTFTGPLVGVEGAFPIWSDRLVFNPNAEFAVADNFILTLNGDFSFILTPQSTMQLWIGTGVGLIHRSAFLRHDQTDLAGNLFVGVTIGEVRVRPYVQVKAMLGKETHTSFVFGVRF